MKTVTTILVLVTLAFGPFSSLSWGLSTEEIVLMSDAWMKTQSESLQKLKSIAGEQKSAPFSGKDGKYYILEKCPFTISETEEILLLQYAIANDSKPEFQLAALGIMIKKYPALLDRIIPDCNVETTDKESLKGFAIGLGLTRAEASIEPLRTLLHHPDMHVRAIAADALGVYTYPRFQFQVVGEFRSRKFREKLRFANCFDHPFPIFSTNQFKEQDHSFKKLPESVCSDLHKLLRLSEHHSVRDAAARTLSMQESQKSGLRVAEWGVWLESGKTGPIRLQSAIPSKETLPDFVAHMSVNPRDVSSRLRSKFIITKPVVFFTVQQPAAVNLSVGFKLGKPQYVYPVPDDYILLVGKGSVPDGDQILPGICNDEPETGVNGCGFPWIEKYQRKFGRVSGTLGSRNVAVGVGITFQNLTIIPKSLNKNIPEYGDPGNNAEWWKRLRRHSTTIITSGKDVEDFLFYDEPSLAETPILATLEDRLLHTRSQNVIPVGRHEFNLGVDGSNKQVWMIPSPSNDIEFEHHHLYQPWLQYKFDSGASFRRRSTNKLNHFALWIESDGMSYNCRTLEVQCGDAQFSLDEIQAVYGCEATEELVNQCKQMGLTNQETESLVECWEKDLFHTPGKRLVTFLRREEYDQILPMTITPTPKEFVRVGLVVTEFE